jgi:uncharacterized protein YcsI (UPF0317 family)
VNNLRFQTKALLQHEAKTSEGFIQSEVENGKTENHYSKNRESLISGVPEGRTVSNLRFQPEEVLQHVEKTPKGFPQSEVKDGKPLTLGFQCMSFPPVKTGGYFKETLLVFVVSICF